MHKIDKTPKPQNPKTPKVDIFNFILLRIKSVLICGFKFITFCSPCLLMNAHPQQKRCVFPWALQWQIERAKLILMTLICTSLRELFCTRPLGHDLEQSAWVHRWRHFLRLRTQARHRQQQHSREAHSADSTRLTAGLATKLLVAATGLATVHLVAAAAGLATVHLVVVAHEVASTTRVGLLPAFGSQR